jgi:hypothetical protein
VTLTAFLSPIHSPGQKWTAQKTAPPPAREAGTCSPIARKLMPASRSRRHSSARRRESCLRVDVTKTECVQPPELALDVEQADRRIFILERLADRREEGQVQASGR